MHLALSQPAPETWESHQVAKAMNDDTKIQGPCAYINESREPSKHSREAELKHCSKNGRQERSVRMRQPELIEVVDVGNAEVERCHEDDLEWLNFGQDMDWDDD